MPLLLKILNAFWPFEDLYLLGFFMFNFFFLLPKAALYEDISTDFSANKVPLFHSRLGSPASLFSSTPVPRSWSIKTVTVLYFHLNLSWYQLQLYTLFAMGSIRKIFSIWQSQEGRERGREGILNNCYILYPS